MAKLDQEAQQVSNQAQQSTLSSTVVGKSLDKLGGFGFVETVVDGMANMNPERKARKQIFLTDSSKREEREDLLKNIQLWLELLESEQPVATLLMYQPLMTLILSLQPQPLKSKAQTSYC